MNQECSEELHIMDKIVAIERLGDENLFFTMMEGFEDITMSKNLVDLKIAMEELDYSSIRAHSHSLKGAASYLGAERVYKAAEKLQLDIENRRTDKVFVDYATLIHECIMLKRIIRSELCKKESNVNTLLL